MEPSPGGAQYGRAQSWWSLVLVELSPGKAHAWWSLVRVELSPGGALPWRTAVLDYPPSLWALRVVPQIWMVLLQSINPPLLTSGKSGN